jgi:hypothetical protein
MNYIYVILLRWNNDGEGEEKQPVIFRTEKGLNEFFMTEYIPRLHRPSWRSSNIGFIFVRGSVRISTGTVALVTEISRIISCSLQANDLDIISFRPDRFFPDPCQFISHRTNDAMQFELLTYYPNIFLKELRKTVRNLSQDIRCNLHLTSCSTDSYSNRQYIRLLTSGIHRRVSRWKSTDVSEELVAFIFILEE